jgi:hypothetical protein
MVIKYNLIHSLISLSMKFNIYEILILKLRTFTYVSSQALSNTCSKLKRSISLMKNNN